MDFKEAVVAETEGEAEAEAEETEAEGEEAELEEEGEEEAEEAKETEAAREEETEAAAESEGAEAAEDSDACGRIVKFEEKPNQHNHVIEVLQDKVTQLSTYFEHLGGEVSALRSAASGIQTPSEEFSALKTQIGQDMNDPVVKQLSTDLKELRKEFLIQKAESAAMLRTVNPSPPFRC
jgi:chromosome segregation ATPase